MKWYIIIAFVVLTTITVQANAKKPSKSPKNGSLPKDSIDRLFNLGKTHKKRGLFASVPTFSKGVDIPIVKHSLLKPFILDYPVQSVQLGVKIPLKPPTSHVKHPVPSGHGFTHHQKPAHIQPNVIKQAWPVNCAPNIPHAPTVTKTEVIPPPTPLLPAPTFQVGPAAVPFPVPALTPVLPLAQPPIPFVNKHFKPLIPIQSEIVAPAPIIPAVAPTPIVPFAAPAIIKPGNSVQSSFFATYPKHPIINTAPLTHLYPAVHQPVEIGRVPVHANKVPINIIPTAQQVPVNIGHIPIGAAHHSFGIAHHAVGVAHHPVGVLHHPITVAKKPVHVLEPVPNFPLGIGEVPFHIHNPIEINRVPIGHLPGSEIPINIGNFPINNGVNIAQIHPTPAANIPTDNVPFNVNGNIPNDNIPIGLGPSPTNVPLGIGDFPLDQTPLIYPGQIPEAGPTVIPTSDSGVIPTVQDVNINGVHNIDTNPWIPMTPTPTIPVPTPPQFIPESETNFAPTETTNIHDQNQGYRYEQNSNIPFEEINANLRDNAFNNNQGFRNHFSLRQHLPLRRPSQNFAGYS